MKKEWAILAALTVSFSTAALASENNQHLRFQNQRGSILNIVLHKNSQKSGQVTGTFQTAVASKKCPQVIGKPKPITGFYTGNAIAFTVSYPSCGAAVAVIGNFDKNDGIETLWIDVHQGMRSNSNDWNTRTIGHDEYKLIKS